MRVAGENDLQEIGRTLARGFEHDPLWGWAFEEADQERKLAALAAVFGFFCEAALGLDWVRVTDGLEAVALWIPPGSPEMSPADEERLPGVIAGACGPESGPRVTQMLDAFERNHPHEPPHFYLSLLASPPIPTTRVTDTGWDWSPTASRRSMPPIRRRPPSSSPRTRPT